MRRTSGEVPSAVVKLDRVQLAPDMAKGDGRSFFELTDGHPPWRLARKEGVCTGPSGGASVLTAMRLDADLGPGHTVVTLQPDSGLNYLSGDLYR
jgi:hypothetical protein